MRYLVTLGGLVVSVFVLAAVLLAVMVDPNKYKGDITRLVKEKTGRELVFEGDVKLTDFGIAKAKGFLTDQEGEVVAGKPDYMSPEQADFQVTDKRSDVFSAGVVLSNLLLGRNIFKGANADESRNRIINQPIPDFRALDHRIDDRLNDILHHCPARDLHHRYATADQLLTELEFYIYGAGYGPTNETLGKYIRELFGQEPAKPVHPDLHGKTIIIDDTTRS